MHAEKEGIHESAHLRFGSLKAVEPDCQIQPSEHDVDGQKDGQDHPEKSRPRGIDQLQIEILVL